MVIDPLSLSRIGFAYIPSFHIGFPVTLEAAAAPIRTLAFLFHGGGLVILPPILTYTGAVTWVLRGTM